MCLLCLWLHIYLIQLIMPYYHLYRQEQPGELIKCVRGGLIWRQLDNVPIVKVS